MGPHTKFTALNKQLPWTDAQKLECVMVIPEAPNVKSFCFRSLDESWFQYTPGQFITLELPLPDGTVMRTYTLSSSPSRPLSISVTVKAQAGSTGSKWMLENMHVGMQLRAFGPAGLFSFHNHPADKYLFISAGSGVTPMFSMARWLFDKGEQPDVTIINAAHRPSELIFRSELERMAQRVSGIKLSFVVKENDPYDIWTGYQGRLNQLMLALMAPDFHEREIFCCGPASFMAAICDILKASNFNMDHYHAESFHAPAADTFDISVPDENISDEEKTIGVNFVQSGIEVVCSDAETILDIAKSAGLNIPNACRFGVCGTCKIRRLSGETNMIHNGGIRDEEIAQGYILACCTKPLGIVEVDI